MQESDLIIYKNNEGNIIVNARNFMAFSKEYVKGF